MNPKSIAFLVLLLSAIAAGAGEPLVSLDFRHSLRIANHRVGIVVDEDGILSLKTESRDGAKHAAKFRVPPERMDRLKMRLKKVDWQKAAADREPGLDGTTVRIAAAGRSATLWSPDYHSRKRGLRDFQDLVEELFALAGLDKSGDPPPPPKQESKPKNNTAPRN